VKVNGLIHFAVVTSATAALMGLVTKPVSDSRNDFNSTDFKANSRILLPDTPEVPEPLPFQFKDNIGNTPNSYIYIPGAYYKTQIEVKNC